MAQLNIWGFDHLGDTQLTVSLTRPDSKCHSKSCLTDLIMTNVLHTTGFNHQCEYVCES